MSPLTKIHIDTLKFLLKYQKENHVMPTHEEMRSYFMLRSTSSTKHRINALRDAGVIAIQRRVPRGIEVIHSHPTVQALTKK